MREGIRRSTVNPASFRDPAARVFQSGDKIIREIYPSYFKDYDYFMANVYPELIRQDLIIPHTEVVNWKDRIVIAPEVIKFISYPYEWPFEMLKEAALVTLRVNQIALNHGMILKDGTAYNVQYHNGKMKFIDTASFTRHESGQPWTAYPQFLRHFLSPLLLIKYKYAFEARLSEAYLDGIPVGYTGHVLPFYCRFNGGMISHLYSQMVADNITLNTKRTVRMPDLILNALLYNLYKFIEGLKYKPSYKGWLKYAEMGSYTPDALKSKKEIVRDCLNEICIRNKYGRENDTVLDLGTNTGEYSKLAVKHGWRVIAIDSYHDCANSIYGDPEILPLVVDICNPSPAIGWANRERKSFWERTGKVEVIMALAILHHLCVRNNIPLKMVAELLAEHCHYLIIEWVPLEDKQAQKLLGNKHIPEYSIEEFTDAFCQHFNVGREFKMAESSRIIYLMENKEDGI